MESAAPEFENGSEGERIAENKQDGCHEIIRSENEKQSIKNQRRRPLQRVERKKRKCITQFPEERGKKKKNSMESWQKEWEEWESHEDIAGIPKVVGNQRDAKCKYEIVKTKGKKHSRKRTQINPMGPETVDIRWKLAI